MTDRELINQLNYEIDSKNSQLSEIHHKYEELKKELEAKNKKTKKLDVWAKDGLCVGTAIIDDVDTDFCDHEGILYFGDITINKDCFAYAIPVKED